MIQHATYLTLCKRCIREQREARTAADAAMALRAVGLYADAVVEQRNAQFAHEEMRFRLELLLKLWPARSRDRCAGPNLTRGELPPCQCKYCQRQRSGRYPGKSFTNHVNSDFAES